MLWTRRISERGLFVLSLTSIVLLLLVSDLEPPQTLGFGSLQDDGEEVRVVCALLDTKRTDGGWVITLLDIESVTARGFCPEELMPTPFPEGTILEIKATVSLDPGLFLFIDGISPHLDEGKL